MQSLRSALQLCQLEIATFSATLTLVDNGNQGAVLEPLLLQIGDVARCQLVENESNRGFGRAHNQVIRQTAADYHLILNPDVILYEDALLCSLQYLAEHPQVVAVSPEVRGPEGRYQYLCKQYPAVLDLALRGFAPAFIHRYFSKRLDRYSCREMIEARQAVQVPLISGCFMLCRVGALQQAGGFDERYFLYFEDFTLSLVLGKYGELHYLPASRIIHFGGDAARKGPRHIGHFMKSAWRFYSSHGWKLW